MSSHDEDKPMTTAELNAYLAESVRLAEAERERDPDPVPTIMRRILNGTLRPDWQTQAEVSQWQEREAARRARLDAMGGIDNLVVEGQVAG